MTNHNYASQKSKWVLVPIGVVATVIASVAAYGQISGKMRSDAEYLRADVATLVSALPEIRDRLTTIETDIAWIKKGMNHE